MSQTLIPSTRNTEAYNAGSLCVSPVPLPQSSVTSGLSLDLPKLLLPEEDSLPICKFPANSNSPFCWPEHIPAPDLVTDLVTWSDQQLHATRGESLLGQKLPESECEFHYSVPVTFTWCPHASQSQVQCFPPRWPTIPKRRENEA